MPKSTEMFHAKVSYLYSHAKFTGKYDHLHVHLSLGLFPKKSIWGGVGGENKN